MEVLDLRLVVPLGVESMSMASPFLTGPLRIETPGGAGRALDAELSMARSSSFEIVGAEAVMIMSVHYAFIIQCRRVESPGESWGCL